MEIGKDDLILGYPFLEATASNIDWKNGQLKGIIILSNKKMNIQLARTIMSTQLAIKANAKKEKKHWKEIVPSEYHGFTHVFEEEESEKFPDS